MIPAYIVAISLAVIICYPAYLRWWERRQAERWAAYVVHVEGQSNVRVISDRWLYDEKD